MRSQILAALLLAIATPAAADPFCDTLLAYIDSAPKNAVPTATIKDRTGPQTVAQLQLQGARCLVAAWNPTGVTAGYIPRQSVNCYWSAPEDKYTALFDTLNARVASCLAQPLQTDLFRQRFEYQTNTSTVRISADQMTDDWAVSVTVEPN